MLLWGGGGSSAVECRTRNQVSLRGYINTVHSGRNVSGLVVARNYCMARMLPGEADFCRNEQVCHGVGQKV